jgi:hypothetical protein
VADVYYRFVRGQVVTLDDFRSQGALGRTLRSPGDERAFNEGVSVYDDFDQACEVAASIRYRRGSYLAVISLPADHAIEVAQTGRNPHHFTMFAEAETILALVAGDPVLIPGAPEG